MTDYYQKYLKYKRKYFSSTKSGSKFIIILDGTTTLFDNTALIF